MENNPVIRADIENIAQFDFPWSRLAKKTIVVTGGGGFLAAYLVKALLCANDLYKLNLTLICVVRSLESAELRLGGFAKLPCVKLVKHDVSQPLPSDFPSADFIIHSASQASPKFYGTDPVGTLKANTTGTMYLLEHAVKCKSEGFIFFSSGEVYGQVANPQKEITELDYGYLDPIQVRACYAESKRIGETMCAAWAHQFGVHTSVVRPFHTYGPGIALDDGRVFADFVADVVAGRDIVLKSDGTARRPFCYIADATLGFLTVLFKGEKSQAYNIANPEAEISMKDLAITLSNLFPERKIGVRFEIAEPRNGYIPSQIVRQCPSIEKISKLGWVPDMGIEEGFRRTILSFV